jgi:hypothetical protein
MIIQILPCQSNLARPVQPFEVPAAQAASPTQPMTFRCSRMDVAAIANFGKWALVASHRLRLSPAVAFFPADGRLGHFTHAHWNLLQSLDKPPARGPGRRHGKAPLFQILAHGMQWHSAPT